MTLNVIFTPSLKSHEQQAQFFKLLTHPARLAILEILRHGEQCVCHMEAHLGCRQAYLSQQLAVLREAGIIAVRRDGWNIFYRVVQPEVYTVLDSAYAATGSLPEPATTGGHDCPCPKGSARRAPVGNS